MKTLVLLALTMALLLLLATSVATADPGPAVVIHDGGCGMLDAQGNIFFDPNAAHAVDTDSETGNSMLVCHSQLPEGSAYPSKAVRWNHENTGLWCSTTFNTTSKWKEVVTPSGKVSLVCHYNPSAY